MINVFITDDHKIVRDGIKALLLGNNDIQVCGESSNGAKTIPGLNQCQADILLLDIGLPDVNGYELIPELLMRFPGLKVVILTANADQDSLMFSIEAGAQGFLNKDTSEDELITAIKTVYYGDAHFFGQSVSQLLFMANKISDIPQKGPVQKLTEREKEVITLLADGLTCAQVGEKLFISQRTVETHKNNLMSKLGLKNLADIIKFAIKNHLIGI